MKNIQLMLLVLFSCLLLCGAEESIDDCKQKRILLEDNYYTIISKLDALEKKVSALETSTGSQSYPVVAFMADLTTSVSGQQHHIYFDDVKLNIGNAYNRNHGTFVAPVNGTYQFTVTACSTAPHFTVLQVNVNQVVLGKMLAGDSVYTDCASKLFLTHLSVGDDVFVQHVDQGDLVYANNNYGLPSFTGLLVRAD